MADLHEDCIRPLCDPASGACAFAQRLPDGTPCADGMGVCASGRCDCRAACGERVCGPDGCGGSCGACAEEEFCSAGECIPESVGPGPHPQLVGNFPAAAQAIAVKGDTGYLGAVAGGWLGAGVRLASVALLGARARRASGGPHRTAPAHVPDTAEPLG